jgi:hypothetical protein
MMRERGKGSEQDGLLEVTHEKKATVHGYLLFSRDVKQKKLQDVFSAIFYLIDELTFDRHPHPYAQMLPRISYVEWSSVKKKRSM